MSNDFDWFDLNKYEPFKKMSIEEWIWQLDARGYYFEVVNMAEMTEAHIKTNHLIEIANNLKHGVIPPDQNYSQEHISSEARIVNDSHYPETYSVKSTTSLDIFKIVKDTRLESIWNACKHVNDWDWVEDDHLDESLSNIAHTPHDFNDKENFNYWNTAHVNINLTASDEQIKNDFNKWLSETRKITKAKNQKKMLKQADFDRWIRFGVIPFIDLSLVSKVEKIKTTNAILAKMIFLDDIDPDTDMVERLRKVTKPMSELIMKNGMANRLSSQLIYEKINGMKII